MPTTRPRLKLISVNSQPRSRTKWQGLDPLGIFIHHTQISVGTRVLNFGRLDHGSVWEIRELHNFTSNGARRRSPTITGMHTQLTLARLDTNETRTMLFQNLSYSAIWRLSNAN